MSGKKLVVRRRIDRWTAIFLQKPGMVLGFHVGLSTGDYFTPKAGLEDRFWGGNKCRGFWTQGSIRDATSDADVIFTCQ